MKRLLFCLILLIVTNVFSQDPNWVQTNGPYGGSMKFIGQDWNGYLFAISENNYLYRSNDSAENWEKISQDVSAIAFRRDSTYYIGNKWGEVFKYDSSFNLIKQIKSFYFKEYGHAIENIYLDSNSNIFLEAEFWGNDFSTDDGKSWENTDLTDFIIDSKNYYYKLKIDTLIRSKDLGQTWDTLIVLGNPNAFQGFERKIIYDNIRNTFVIFGTNIVYVIKEMVLPGSKLIQLFRMELPTIFYLIPTEIFLQYRVSILVNLLMVDTIGRFQK